MRLFRILTPYHEWGVLCKIRRLEANHLGGKQSISGRKTHDFAASETAAADGRQALEAR